ncbi:MAG: STAS domain-containing protein [Gallionella sp.]|nr:STAS domain-containing protein [Gallionella sp.]
MTISVQTYNNMARISVSGRFDFSAHVDFKNAYMRLIENVAIHKIEIEMSAVEYIDSSALCMLMQLDERVKIADKMIVLLDVSCAVLKVLKVACFDKIFTLTQSALPTTEYTEYA